MMFSYNEYNELFIITTRRELKSNIELDTFFFEMSIKMIFL